MSAKSYISPAQLANQESNAHKLPGNEPQIRCHREGCSRWFRPRNPVQKYHNSICAKIAKKMLSMESDRVRRENNRIRFAQLRDSRMSDEAKVNARIDSYLERSRDPDYYTGVRHQGYSSLVSFVMPPGPARARGKSATTNRERK